MDKRQSTLDRCIKNKDGRVELAQYPNLPIIVWILCIILQQFLAGDLYKLINIIGFGALFTWAWLEIFTGINYFRRALGFIVMFATLYSYIY